MVYLKHVFQSKNLIDQVCYNYNIKYNNCVQSECLEKYNVANQILNLLLKKYKTRLNLKLAVNQSLVTKAKRTLQYLTELQLKVNISMKAEDHWTLWSGLQSSVDCMQGIIMKKSILQHTCKISEYVVLRCL